MAQGFAAETKMVTRGELENEPIQWEAERVMARMALARLQAVLGISKVLEGHREGQPQEEEREPREGAGVEPCGVKGAGPNAEAQAGIHGLGGATAGPPGGLPQQRGPPEKDNSDKWRILPVVEGEESEAGAEPNWDYMHNWAPTNKTGI